MLKMNLRDCPFCGPKTKDGERVEMTETSTVGADSYTLGYTIRCGCCGIEMNDEYDTTLVKRWNHRAADPVPVVRCSECGWHGRADELGLEGECGADLNCNGRPTEITEPADLIQAWLDSEGTVAGKQLSDAGLIAPRPSTANEAGALDMEPGDTVWDLTEAGEAVLNAAKAEG